MDIIKRCKQWLWSTWSTQVYGGCGISFVKSWRPLTYSFDLNDILEQLVCDVSVYWIQVALLKQAYSGYIHLIWTKKIVNMVLVWFFWCIPSVMMGQKPRGKSQGS